MKVKHENDFAHYELKEDLVYITYKKGTVIDLNAAKEIVLDRIRFQEEKHYPVLCDIRAVHSMDYLARDYLTREGLVYITTLAILIKAGAIDLMTQLHHTSHRPAIRTGVFRKISEAKEFLNRNIELLIPICWGVVSSYS